MVFAVAIVITLVVSFILGGVIGVSVAVIVSLLVLASWLWFNPRSGNIRLIKAIMNPYFVSRSMGAAHEEALEKVIKSRYPFSKENQAEVRSRFCDISPGDSEKEALKNLVYIMYSYELLMELPPYLRDKVFITIDKVYNSLSSHYGFRNRGNAARG